MSAVQLQTHSVASPENSDTMSRSDVALHEATNKNTIPAHATVLAKDDEETHNHDAGGHGSTANGTAVNVDDGTGSDAQQNKSCWAFLTCCFAKPVQKAKDSTNDNRPYGGDKKQSNAESSVPMAAKQNGEDSKTATAVPATTGGGAAASLMTQVSQDAPAPIVPPVQFTAIRPPPTKCLLGPLTEAEKGKKTLVLDLDETLVHSSFKPIPNADFVISIELENVIHRVFVLKRPGVDAFLRAVGQKFEVVVFTASLAKYADPLLDILDRSKVVKTRLFREACVHHYGNYVKDLSHLGRRLEDTIIIDNSPFSYMFQPDNAIPITSWFNDKTDRQLYDLLPFLDSLTTVDDVCTLLHRRKQAQLAAGTNMA